MRTVTDKINIAVDFLQEAERDLAAAPEKSDIIELLEAIEVIDEHYKNRYCEEIDEDCGDEPGTAYEEGINMEFYIEAAWWHDVSKAFRKLKKNSE